MPDLVVLVTGTATEIGKTWLAARLAEGLRGSGEEVVARKPVMSYAPDDTTTDARVLAGATGEDETRVCPEHRRYEVPMAPPMAADVLGRASILIDDLVKELDLEARGTALVEGVGGVRSPMAHDGDAVTLAERINPHLVLLVAPSGLGAINDVLTSLDTLDGRWPVLVFLNRFDESDETHRRNLRWLQETLPGEIAVTVPEVLRHVLDARRNNLGASVPTAEVT